MTSEGRVQTLGAHAVAEHPAGHRVVGIVIGCGSEGVMLASPPLRAGFLAYVDGWTVTVTTPARVSPDKGSSEVAP